MPVQRSAKIPEAILHLQQQLDQWRSAQKGRTKLPESFWQAAVDLAKQYGVFRTAQPLRLDYTRLKQRLSGAAQRQESCVIEFESAQGGKMRVRWRSNTPPDWTNLLRAWRDGDR